MTLDALTHLLLQQTGLVATADWWRAGTGWLPNSWPTLAQPAWLLLLSLPILLGLWRWRSQQRVLDYADPHLRPWALVEGDASSRRRGGRLLWGSFWVLLALALADPQVPHPQSPTGAMRPPVMLVLDTSSAMTVTDVSPDRAARARALIDLLAKRLPDVPLGLMVYADRAGTLLPPTRDRGVLDYFVDQTGGLTAHVDAPRPDLALARAARMTDMVHGVVVWLTSADSRSFEGPLGTAQLGAAEALAKQHRPIFAVIEAGSGGDMRDGNAPLTDIQGNVQHSTPAPARVAELASMSGGAVHATTSLPDDVAFLVKHIQQLPALPPEPGSGKRTVSIHQLPLILAGLLLGILLWRVGGGYRRRTRSETSRSVAPLSLVAACGIAVVLALSVWPSGVVLADESAKADQSTSDIQSNRTAIAAGERALVTGDYGKAQVELGAAKGFAARFGSGVSAYRRGDYAFAVGQFQAALWLAADPARRQQVLFNLGDALVLVGRYQAALDAFDAVLAAQPDNEAAKKNRLIVATLLDKQARNRKNEPKYAGHRNAIYGYYHEPDKSKMDDRMLDSQGASAGGSIGPGERHEKGEPFKLTPDLAGSARRKLDLLRDQPDPLLKALIEQQIYTLPKGER